MQPVALGTLSASLARGQSAGRSAARVLRSWWHIVHLGALIVALALSPSSWRRPWRSAIARHVWLGCGPVLLSFGLMSTVLSVVIMRIVLVTAQTYGLSQYALEMVVRVLVLELIPLTAALFVALRVSLPAAVELAELRNDDALAAMREDGIDVLRSEIMPRAIGSLFAVLMLAAVSSVICLVLAYLLVHGFSPWGLEHYTRLVGRIFGPAVTLIFVLKTLGMAAAVSLIPIGAALHGRPDPQQLTTQAGFELSAMVRMFFMILLIELASLVGNYY
jgi:phospholipid/cholesterol/gamma-HCH transport system permease protein